MDRDIEAKFLRMASTGAGQVLAEYLKERQLELDKELRIALPQVFQQVQGRALEIDKLLKLIT